MRNGRKTLLLTGASGVVGRALIEELADDYDIVCLRHRRPVEDPRVREIAGDLGAPSMGLDEQTAADLAAEVDVLLHCGASTSWRATKSALFDANVEGTRRALEFAERAGAVFYHVSTAFVENKVIADDDRDAGPMAYVASKVAAEELIAKASVPVVMVRPSIFTGDSRDGHISAFQGVYQVSGSILKNQLPVLPADPDNLIDYIPQDIAALAIRRLLERGTDGGEWWLTAGADAATLGDMVRVTLEVAEENAIPVHPPRLVPASMVGRLLIPLLDDVMTPALRRHFEMQLDLLRLFQHDSALPSSLRELGIEVTRESQATAFKRANEYWAAKHGLAAGTPVGQGAR